MTQEKQLYKTTRIIWYISSALQALLVFRFLLKLLGANPAAGFTNFIYTLSSIPMAPFKYVFGNSTVGGSIFEWSTLLAMLVYWFVFAGITKLVVMNRPIHQVEAEVQLAAEDNKK